MNEELIVKSIAAVDEWIYFYFKSIRFNFHFILDFGDETNYKHESGTYWKSFSDYFSSLRHSYSSPGIYNVTWTIWNTMYTEVRYKVIRVEYPIPNGSLSIYPLTEYIQIPDGKSELTLHYSSEKPNPTNVRCIFQYGEWEETQSVNLTNGIPIWKVYFYESAGQKNVNFTCTNDLTSQSVNATMYVESYKLSEFEFEYETPVPMNMTLERVEPTEEYRHYYRSVSVPVNVTFTISLKKFERFPSGITVIWDFGDNSPVEEFPLVSKTRTHTFFVKRGTYTMAIEIGSKYNTHILHRNITLGVIQFSCYPTEFDFRYTNVTFAAKGIPGAAIYTFYTDSSSTIYRGSSYNAINNVMNVSIYTVEYLEYGFYFPSVYGYGERVYLDQPLIADYKLEDRLYLDVRPYPNPLPPGDITLRVRTLSREPRPYVTCILKAGDAVDRDSVFYKTQNITKTQPIPRVNLRGPKIILSDTSSSACSVKEVSRGVGQLASSVSEVFDYALTVTVMEGSSQNHFTQIARFKKEGSTDLQINCSLNCDDKVAVSSKLALIAWCASCKPEHRVQFEWQLWKDESGSGLQFLPLVTGTDAGKQSFVLPKFLLTPGNTYLVTLYMTVDNESDISGDVYRKLRTNVPPTGGACSFNQKTDSLVVLLSVQCSNWIDPDEDENVFTYLYETVTMRNFTHGEESVVNFIYEGNITVDIVDTFIDCLEYGSRRNPLSPIAVESLTDIANVYHRVLDNVLNKMLPQRLQNLDVELLEEDIKAEIMLNIKFFLQETSLLNKDQGNVTFNHESINKQTNLIYQIRAHEREIQLQQRNTARKFIPIIKKIQAVFLNVMLKTIALGEGLQFNGKHVLEIVMRKTSINNLANIHDEFFAGVQEVNGSDTHVSYLKLSVTNFLRNPYIYGENASKAISSVPVIDIPQNISVDSNIPNKGNLEFKRYIPLINPQYSEQMIYFAFEMTNDEDAGIIYIKPDGFDFLAHQKVPLYSFYFSSATFPTSSVFGLKKVLGVRDWTKYGFKVFLPGDICGKGLCYLGIKPLTAPDPDDFSGSRKRRAVEPQTTIGPPENRTLFVNASDFVPVEANFSMIFTTTGCRTWKNGNNSWTMEGCQVLPMSDLNNTVCRCVGDTFSTSFYVPPNAINFLTVWGKFDASNATVYGALVVVFVIYIILLIVLRRQDKKDQNRSKVAFLCDHNTTHTYFYLISVYTGFRRRAGTKSNVYFILTGDDDDSGIRFLNDGFQEGFSTSSVNMYFFGTNEPLGDLRYIRIWHDNSGPPGFKSWFLSKIIIENLEQKERYTFHCNKWLGIDDEDCMLDRIIPVSSPDKLSYSDRISVEAQSQMPVYHLWLSLLYRPQLGKFTRVQRLSCLVALLCLTMISNAIFFQSSDENQNVEEVNFGILRLSFGTVYVSCIGMLISTPPVTFAAFVFRNTKNSKSAAHKIANSKEQSSDKSFSNLDGDVFTPSKGTLPRWVFYVAWVSVVLAILSSSFFLILYSMEWGKSKSNEWLSSLAFSILESFIVFDPIKVLFFAIICSTVFKSLMMEELHKVNVENLRLTSKSTNVSQRTTFSDLANKVLPKCDTFSKEEINKLRKKCREETQARSALTSLVVFILYILAIYGISFTQRDQRSLSMKQNLDNHLLLGSHGFSSLKGRKDFISWMNETFIPTYYPNASYAGKPLTVLDRQWFKDMASIRVGPARLRQVRMKTGTCPYSYLPWSYPCVDSYSETEEDKNSYCLRWKPYNDTICGSELYKSRFYTAEAWRYTDAVEIWGMSRMGEYKTYSGGGYILKFVKDKVNAHLLLKELLDNNWIDRKTRAIFVEFTIYNPNVNLFTYSMYLVEFSEVGSAFTWTDTQAFKPVLNLSSLGFTIVMCYVFFLFYYIFMLFKIILQCREIGCIRFIKEPWNFVDCLCTFLAYSCLVAFILRMKYTNTAMDMFYDDKLTGANRFINYGHIVMWDNAFNVLFATLLFVSTIQILKILGYNKRFTEVISVISNVGKDLLAFGALLLILFVSFVLYAYLLFGSKLESYKSIYQTCGSLANTFIGKNKLDPLIVAAPLSAQFFYSVYVLCVIMFMLTIFMAILNTSISAVRAETVASAAKIGMLDIVKKFVKNILEVFQKPRKSSRVNRKQEHSANEEINAANVLGLVREIVCVYGNIETKLSNKKYSVEDYQRSLLSPTSRPTFCKVKNRYNEIFDQKHPTEHLEMKEKGASRETFRQVMSRMSYVSASNVEMHIPLCDSDEIDAQRERYQFTIF
ncbi:uncharacterized protein LOC134283266 [Saccostrea cucullata]|uniref:uncharacterized protein LOC134283266 n=1 Tax=Saccostrea cuccullata TaxID=36930 RepID=UPI002ED0E32A